MFNTTRVLIQGFDVLDITKYIGKANKRYQATLLSKVEELVPDKETYLLLRKTILDASNDYTREIVTLLFGDIENA